MTDIKAASPLAASGTDSGPPAVTRSFPGLPESASAARSLGHHLSRGYRYGACCWDSAGAGVTAWFGRP
jgi:hypothetical protein